MPDPDGPRPNGPLLEGSNLIRRQPRIDRSPEARRQAVDGLAAFEAALDHRASPAQPLMQRGSQHDLRSIMRDGMDLFDRKRPGTDDDGGGRLHQLHPQTARLS